MAEKQKTISPEDARKVVEAVIGKDKALPAFGSKLPGSGDICLVLRAGGGCDMVSIINADQTDEAGKPLDMSELAIRGMVLMSLYKMAHHEQLMAEVLSVVTDEFNSGKGVMRLDS